MNHKLELVVHGALKDVTKVNHFTDIDTLLKSLLVKSVNGQDVVSFPEKMWGKVV